MAKSKTTVAQSYYHGEAEIVSFMKGEIGTEKEARARMEKMQKKALEKLDVSHDKKQMDKLMDYLSVASKVKHHQYYNSFNEYSTMMHKYLDPKKGTLSPEELDNIIQKSKEVRFHKLFSNKELKWKSESGIKAIGKYATLLVENDFRKFSFYKTCIS